MPLAIGLGISPVRLPQAANNPSFWFNGTAANLDDAAVAGPALTWTDPASNGTMWNSAGLLQYRPHQLLENANLTDVTAGIPSGWLDGGAASANTYESKGAFQEVTFTASTNRPYIANLIAVEVSTIYTIGFYYAGGTTTTGKILFTANSTGGGTEADIDVSDLSDAGWYAVSCQMGAADTSLTLRFGPGTEANVSGELIGSRPFVIKGGLPGVGLNSPAKLSGPPLGRWIGTDDGDEPKYEPRLAAHYYNGSAWVNGGYLVEGARTNSLLQSRGYDTTWTEQGTPTSAQDETGADGVANAAWTLGDDNVAAAEGWLQIISGIANNNDTHCFCVRIKKDTDTSRFPEIGFQLTGGTVQQVFFHVNTQTGATQTTTSTGTVDHGTINQGDWWLAWGNVTNNTSGNISASCFIFPARGTVFGTRSNTTTGTIVADHSQFEQNASFSSSTIPTTTAAVTRNADNLAATIGDDEMLTSVGTVFVEGQVADVTTSMSLFEIHDGTNNDWVRCTFDSGARTQLNVFSGGVSTGLIRTTAAELITANTDIKWAARYKTDDFAAVHSGGTVGTDTSGAAPTGSFTTIKFGSQRIAETTPQYGFVKQFKGFQIGKSDTELKQLTA